MYGCLSSLKSTTVCLVFLSALLLSTRLAAQSLPNDTAMDDLGVTPYASYHGGDIDNISMTNGTVSLNLPLLSYPQRGKLGVSFNLMYNNEPEHYSQLCDPTCEEWDWDLDNYQKPLPSFTELGHVFVAWGQQVQAYGITSAHKVGLYYYLPANWFVTTADGSTHILGNLGTSSYVFTGAQYEQTQTGNFESIDATGWWMSGPQTSYAQAGTNVVGTGTVVVDANGNRYSWSGTGSTTQDSNGNEITTTTAALTDTVGRIIPFPPTSQSAQSRDNINLHSKCTTPPGTNPPGPDLYAVAWNPPSYDGQSAQYVFCYSTVTPNMSGGLTGPAYGYVHVGLTLYEIVLPNNQIWIFHYDDQDATLTYNGQPVSYGTLSSVTLPTGGTISYTYTTMSQRGLTCQNGGRWVTSRTVDANDGTGPHTWTYTYSLPSVIVTDPLHNDTVHTFTGYGNCTMYETETDYYQGSHNGGTLLKKVVTAYNADTTSPNVNPKGAANVVPTQIDTYYGTSHSWVTKSYDAGFQYQDYLGGTTHTGLYGQVKTETDHDFGGGSTIRVINYKYQREANSAYAGTDNLINLVNQVQITDGTNQTALTQYGYDETTAVQTTGITQHLGTPHDSTHRGNRTSITRWRNLPTAKNLVTHLVNFDTGELKTSTDPLSNVTTYTYDTSTLQGSLVTGIQYPTTGGVLHKESFWYDTNTGLKTSSTDQNLQTTTYDYDQMGREVSVSYPDGGSVGYSYDDSPPVGVTITTKINSSQEKTQVLTADGLGRTVTTQLTSDPEGTDTVATTYDADGRKATVTTPYRTTGDSTYGVTHFQAYDGLGRLLTQQQADGSTIQYTYSGITTTITDEAGKQRKTLTDALGRLKTVWEGPSGYETDYSYDTLGNLTSVVQQSSRNRTFTYDSLSRLLSAVNPEIPTPTTYTYDDADTLISKTTGLGTITYAPDALHRIVSKSYSDGEQTIHYCYDNVQTSCGTSSVTNGVDRRTGMSDGSGNTAWSYDLMGRVASKIQTINGVQNSTLFDYNQDGSLSTLIYPTSDEAEYTYSDAGRVTGVEWIGILEGGPLASNILYAPAGQVASYVNGANVTVTNTYNNRLQPLTAQAAGSQGNFFSLTYNFNAGSSDNGNLAGVTNTLNGARSQSFTYDNLNRLSSAGTSATWGDSYGYDSWGNLLSKTITKGTAESLSVTVDANNHLNGYGYDGNGNLTSLNGVTYNHFNIENQWTSQTTYGVTYLYDGDGNRVKSSGGASGTRVYWYDDDGNVVDQTDQSGIPTLYFYLNGAKLAEFPSLNNFYYYYGDHLGTTRMMTDSSGAVCYDADFFPWGSEQSVLVNTCSQNYKFTGKERDPDMHVDYFGARFYEGATGRMYSPDPIMASASRLRDPQRWNAYAYVRNNPMSYVDPDGRDADSASADSGGGTADDDTNDSTPDSSTEDKKGSAQTGSAQSNGGTSTSIVTVSATTSGPGTLLGGLIGELIDPIGGGIPGSILGSMLGVGGDISYVPATGSCYVGPTLSFTPAPFGGSGLSVSSVVVPPGQNANSIANGTSVSVSFQPRPLAGSTVTKSPGSGPAVAGPSAGTKVPLSISVSHNFDVTKAVNAINNVVRTVESWFF